jgi:hypothetical protein
VTEAEKIADVLQAALEENIALRSMLGGGCDANNEGAHPSIVSTPGNRFCTECGETVDGRNRSKPWFSEERLERVKARLTPSQDGVPQSQ